MTWGGETDADEAAAQLVAFHDAGGTLVDTRHVLLGWTVRGDPRPPARRRRSPGGAGHRHEGRPALARRAGRDRRLARRVARPAGRRCCAWKSTTSTCGSVHTSTTPSRRGDAGGAGRRGELRQGPLRRRVELLRLATARAATWQRAVPGRAPLVANQVRYSLLDRGIEREVVPACDELGVGVFPFSPLGGGVLTGKYRDGVPADSARPAPAAASPIPTAATAGIVEAVATAADGLGDLAGCGGPGLGARPARRHRADRRRADVGPADGRAELRGVDLPWRSARRSTTCRHRDRLPGGRRLTSAAMTPIRSSARSAPPGCGRASAQAARRRWPTPASRARRTSRRQPRRCRRSGRSARAGCSRRSCRRPGLRGGRAAVPPAPAAAGTARRRLFGPPRRDCCVTIRGDCSRCPG